MGNMKSKKRPITDKKRMDAIVRCLDHIEEISSISSDGKPSINVDVLYYFVEEILYEYFPLDEYIPERTKRGIIFSAQMRWLKYKKTGSKTLKLHSFKRAVETEFRKIKKKQSKYTVLMFLNVDSQTIGEFTKVEILGDTLTFISWQDISALDIKNLWQEVKFQNKDNPILWNFPDLNQPTPDQNIFTPILFEIYTYGPEAAIEISVDRIDLLRVIFNLPLALGGFSYFRTVPKALSEILPTPIYVIFNNEGKRVSTYFTIEKYNYKLVKIPSDQRKSIQYLLSKFEYRSISNSSWQFVLDILRQYQKALDTSTIESGFLAMWQVLENSIGFGEELIRNNQIQSRVSDFVRMDPITTDILEILIDKRNKYVHSGKFLEDGDHLFFILKLITDSVVRSLISYSENFKTLAELREFVSFSSLGDGDLRRKLSVIEKIEEFRSKNEQI